MYVIRIPPLFTLKVDHLYVCMIYNLRLQGFKVSCDYGVTRTGDEIEFNN